MLFAPESGTGTGTPPADTQPAGGAADTQPGGDAKDTVQGGEGKDTVEGGQRESLISKNELKEPTKSLPFDPKALKLPDGVEITPEALDTFTPVAQKHGLSQEAAQELLSIHASTLKELADAPMKAWNDTRDAWVSEVQADKELGGAALAQVKTTISRALDVYGDPKVKEALNVTGAGDHPAIIRTLFRMAKALTEGGHVAGNPPTATAPPKGPQALYPDLPPG